jgi:outer membrane protein assembly factor BamD
MAGMLASTMATHAQVTGSSQTTSDANGQQQESVTLSASPDKKDKVVQSKDTKKELRKEKKLNPEASEDAKLPDKELYDKAEYAIKKGRFDVGRLDLQTLLNTYPDSQYLMRAKLAVADSWFKEGGTAALMQAESEYKDFITFFPNAPEAAEAQMRVGDIYFRQMDKPDRDYSKATHAEEEYRLMIQQFPDSPLVPQAKQRLREVQEVLATRESEIGEYYFSRNNWPATIARYQTVIDTYPEYSHMDDVLIGLGDAYESEAHYVRSMNLPEAGKARLEQVYDGNAAAAYRRVVLEHSASPHVEDAKDRLAAMSLPIPTPTPEQVAASVALENSRRQYRLEDRAKLMFLHEPDVVMAAREGEPTLVDPPPTIAPHVTRQIITDFQSAMNPGREPAAAATPETTAAAPAAATQAAPAEATPAVPLAFQNIPTAAGGANTSAVNTDVPGATTPAAVTSGAGASGAAMGVQILTPGATAGGAASNETIPGGTTAAPEATGGLKAVGPPNATPLPAIEKPTVAPDAVNDIKPGSEPAAQTSPDGKKKNPEFDKDTESSSKHKKKKGLKKLNPF